MIDPTHEAQVRAVTTGPAVGGLTDGRTVAATVVPFVAFVEPLSSQRDADRFGVELERRYRMHLDPGGEALVPVETQVRARPFGGAAWTCYRVETAPVVHDAGDDADHVELAMERLEHVPAGWPA